MEVTDLIAIGGLTIASISLGWNILNEIRSVPRAKVSVMIAKFFQQGNPRSGKDDYFNITISNIGKRPVLVKGVTYVGYKWWWHPFKKNYYVIIPRKLPIYLKDGEDHNESFAYTRKQFKELLDTNIQGIAAWDSIGQYHWVSREKLWKFRKRIGDFVKRETKCREEADKVGKGTALF